MLGLIIGKGGEMIKKIQQESGSRVQFKQEDDMGGPNRVCQVTGDDRSNETAAGMINDLIQNGIVGGTFLGILKLIAFQLILIL